MPQSNLQTLAVIPARGGSKGVPGKNIRLLDGKPLIAYTIETALQTAAVNRCIVNTDDEKIAAVAASFGAEVMMRRPGQAEDFSPVLPTIIDTLEYAGHSDGKDYDLVMVLQPTAPLRRPSDIEAVLNMFESDTSTEAVISVVPVGDHHPARMYSINEVDYLRPLNEEEETQRRQDIPPVYIRNGCIYASRVSTLLREHTLMPANKKAYIMPAEWLANIDTERDFLFAEFLMKQWKKA